MKKYITVFFLLTSYISHAQNLIPNGDFETGPSGTSVGWQYLLTSACGVQNGTPGPSGWSATNLTPDRKVEGTIYCNWDNDTAASGSAYIMLGNTEGGKVTLTQALEMGAQYTLSYSLQMETLRGATYVSPRVAFYFNNGGNTITSDYITNYTSWTSYSNTFTATAASTEMEIRGLVANGGTEIDKVSLIKIASTLPITLTQFTADEKNRIVHLNWTTSSEINNDYFLIQKSYSLNEQESNDELDLGWENIGLVDGAGNSSVINSYSFRDEYSATRIIYYRLKQVDYDGNFSYSPIRIVKPRSIEAEVSISPNPFVSSIIFSVNKTEPMTVAVYDATSNKILEQNFTQGISINTEEFSPGMYFYQVYDKNGVIKKGKMVKP
jgi:hypothetical protein